MTANRDWTAQRIVLLRALWAKGHSTSVIGRQLGVTKNGKAHRLGLSKRISPVTARPSSGVSSGSSHAM